MEQPNVRDAMLALGWTAAAWQQAGHGYDPYGDYGRGVWTISPYQYGKLTPPVVVAASGPLPRAPPARARTPTHRLRVPSSPARSQPVSLRAGSHH